MLAPIPNVWRWWFSNQTTPTTTPGTSVVPGTSNAEGSATVLATAAQLTEDVCGVLLVITGGFTAAAIKNHLLDLGVDPAGGTTYDWRVENLGVGSSGAVDALRAVYLPISIPKGSQVACRIQGSNATAGTVLVWATFYGKPSNPEAVWCATYSEVIGAFASSCGPAVVPGVAAAEGAWTAIATTVRRLRYLVPCLQMNAAATTTQVLHMDVSIDVGGANQIIAENVLVSLPGSSEVISDKAVQGFYCDIPAGSAVEVRLSTSKASAETYNVHLVGLG